MHTELSFAKTYSRESAFYTSRRPGAPFKPSFGLSGTAMLASSSGSQNRLFPFQTQPGLKILCGLRVLSGELLSSHHVNKSNNEPSPTNPVSSAKTHPKTKK